MCRKSKETEQKIYVSNYFFWFLIKQINTVYTKIFDSLQNPWMFVFFKDFLFRLTKGKNTNVDITDLEFYYLIWLKQNFK